MSDTDAAPAAAGVAPAISPWWTMSIVMAATTIVTLDQTIVNVALHSIGKDLGAGSGIEWIVIAYLLAVCVSQPATGWLADRFGRKTVFIGSIVAFTCASCLCALSPTLTVLIAARVVQGFGGGALIPLGMAMAMDLFPPERRGRSMAVWATTVMVAPAIGPTVGGWLVSSFSWHWLFLINVPFGVATVLAGLRLLPASEGGDQRPFDLPGLLLGAIGLSTGVIGVSQGGQWGWSSPIILACLSGSVTMLGAFVLHELRVRDPLIEVRMFAIRPFRLAVLIAMLLAVTNFARFIFVPLQMQAARGFTAFEVGLMFIPAAIASAIGMQVGGHAADRIGPRRPIVIGCVGVVVSMVGLWRLDRTSSVGLTVALMALQGVMFGMAAPPLLVAGLGQVPSRILTQASAIRSITKDISGATGVAVMTAVVTAQISGSASGASSWAAYKGAYVVAAFAGIVAVVLAVSLRPASDEGPFIAEGVGATAGAGS
ncbi:MAG: DHA2 family efflux MFS transporter permease subunit [Actinomycetota bacterium]